MTWEGWWCIMAIIPASCQSWFTRLWIPPFAERKGARGMLTVQQLPAHPLRLAGLAPSPYAEAKGTGKSCQSFPHHVNHGSPPLWIPAFAGMTCCAARMGTGRSIMAIIRPSWQSWFTPLWIPAFAGMTGDIPLSPLRSAKGGGAEHHGNHFKIMAIMVQRFRGWIRVSLREID